VAPYLVQDLVQAGARLVSQPPTPGAVPLPVMVELYSVNNALSFRTFFDALHAPIRWAIGKARLVGAEPLQYLPVLRSRQTRGAHTSGLRAAPG
jgi:hypothetical protein